MGNRASSATTTVTTTIKDQHEDYLDEQKQYFLSDIANGDANNLDAVKIRAANDTGSNETPPAPDGGWGWFVVFGSFMIHVINDGIAYSFGLFNEAFIEEFKESHGATGFIVSILVGVTLCSGPISSAFVNRYGCRTTTIVGSILASGSTAISIYANSITFLCCSIGLGVGMGLGLVYLPAIVSVTMYFEKYRALATGIAVCGAGFGTVLLAPVFDFFINAYGWKCALLMTSAILSTCALFGILFRPLEFTAETQPPTSVAASPSIAHSKSQREHEPFDSYTAIERNASFDTNTSPRHYNMAIGSTAATGTNGIKRPHSIAQFYVQSSNANTRPYQKFTQNDLSRIAFSHPVLNDGETTASSASQQPHQQKYNPYPNYHYRQHQYYHRVPSNAKKIGPLHKKDIFYQGSLLNLPQYRSKHDLKPVRKPQTLSESEANAYFELDDPDSFVTATATVCDNCDLSDDEYRAQAAPLPQQQQPSPQQHSTAKQTASIFCGLIDCSPATKDTLAKMFDFSLLQDPIFLLFSFSNFCTSIGFNVPYVYIVSRARLSPAIQASTQPASSLISIIGIGNTISRIVFGYLCDKPQINRLMLYNWNLTVCGLATILSAFCYDFFTYSVYCTVFGFTAGAYVGLTSVILVDLLGLDKLTNSFGLLLMFQGIASFLGVPIAGWLYDIFESYDPGFYTAGLSIMISGLVLFFIPAIQRYQQRKTISL